VDTFFVLVFLLWSIGRYYSELCNIPERAECYQRLVTVRVQVKLESVVHFDGNVPVPEHS